MISNCTVGRLLPFICLDIFFRMGMGISEAVIVSIYKQYEHSCYNIWYLVLASCVTDLVCYFLFLFAVGGLSLEKRKSMMLILIGKLMNFVIMIISTIQYYGIDKPCYTFWSINASEVYCIVMIHHLMLWIHIICIPIIIIYCFCQSNDDNSQTGVIVSNQIQSQKKLSVQIPIKNDKPDEISMDRVCDCSNERSLEENSKFVLKQSSEISISLEHKDTCCSGSYNPCNDSHSLYNNSHESSFSDRASYSSDSNHPNHSSDSNHYDDSNDL
jgi:hypothetical protein